MEKNDKTLNFCLKVYGIKGFWLVRYQKKVIFHKISNQNSVSCHFLYHFFCVCMCVCDISLNNTNLIKNHNQAKDRSCIQPLKAIVTTVAGFVDSPTQSTDKKKILRNDKEIVAPNK